MFYPAASAKILALDTRPRFKLITLRDLLDERFRKNIRVQSYSKCSKAAAS